ncbi:hypothetical protein HQ585_00440 [candidate division KSB1 bacterium]|nr:hypothetical protein [candidate division KSB1 bacterium]
MKQQYKFIQIGRLFPILTVCAIALIASCTLFDLSAPTWDTHFTVPLINKTYTMNKFIEDEDNLIVGGDGLVAYTLTGEIEPFELGGHLRTDNLESHLFFFVDQNFTTNTQSGAVKLSEQYKITEAIIKEGSLYIETHNPTRYEIESSFTFEDFQNASLPSSVMAIPDNSAEYGPYDIAGAVVYPDPSDSVSIRYQIRNEKVGEGSNGDYSGNIEVVVRIENVVFEQVSGVLNQVTVPLDTVDTELNLPEQLEGIEFGPLTLQLTIDNGADVHAEADIQFDAINKAGESETITGGGSVEGNSINTLDIDGFEAIINHFPQQLYFYGSLSLGDGKNPSVVRYDDVIQGSYFAEVPLVFRLDDYMNETEPDTIDLGQDAQDAFRDNMLEAHLMIEAFNHLPLGATVEIIFSRSKESVYNQNADVVKVLRLNPGETPQGQEGTIDNPVPVIGSGESIIDFGLTKDELEVFERDQIFFGTRISFDATPGFVQVSPEDYITLRSWIDAAIHMKVPEEDEEQGGGA